MLRPQAKLQRPKTKRRKVRLFVPPLLMPLPAFQHSIEQKTSSRNPRSTVGTVTEIYDYLRLLYARIGRVFCFQCEREISSQTVQHIVDQVQGIPLGKKIMILSPIARERKGEFKKEESAKAA